MFIDYFFNAYLFTPGCNHSPSTSYFNVGRWRPAAVPIYGNSLTLRRVHHPVRIFFLFEVNIMNLYSMMALGVYSWTYSSCLGTNTSNIHRLQHPPLLMTGVVCNSLFYQLLSVALGPCKRGKASTYVDIAFLHKRKYSVIKKSFLS